MTAGIVLIVAALGCWIVTGEPYYEDEVHHYSQIRRFLNGNIGAQLGSSMLPGYHFVLAALGHVTGIDSLDGMRRFSLFFSLLSALVFYDTRRRLASDEPALRTLQYFALPILFPLFFMVYTDSLHLLLLLLSLWAYADGRFKLAGLMGGLCLLVRQSNVIWLAMLFVMIYVDQWGFQLSRRSILGHLRRCWVFVVDFAVFSAFVIWNGGVAVGAFRDQHKAWPPSAGNVFFSLIVLGLLLLPSHLGQLRATRGLIRRHPLVPIAAIATVLAAFMLDFAADHPWNVDDPWYLRNRLLDWIKQGAANKLVAFLPIAVALLSLSVTGFVRRSMILLYPFWILSLLPVEVIAPRYHIIPLVLLLLFKSKEDPKVELTTAAYLFLLTALLSAGVFAHQYTL